MPEEASLLVNANVAEGLLLTAGGLLVIVVTGRTVSTVQS